MTSITAERKSQGEKIAYWGNQMSTEEAVIASKRISQLEESLCDLVKGIIRDYVEFGVWASRVETHWSTNPDQYDENVHNAILFLRKNWFGLFGRLIGLLDSQGCIGLRIDRADEARNFYRQILSIEAMDQAEVTDRLQEAAEQAVADWRSGKAKEM